MIEKMMHQIIQILRSPLPVLPLHHKFYFTLELNVHSLASIRNAPKCHLRAYFSKFSWGGMPPDPLVLHATHADCAQ